MYELIVKKSRFIGIAARVGSADEAKAFIARAAAEHKRARHIAYAYVTGGAEKYSDGGEPSGTAGLPALSAIKRRELTDIAVVVARYFGGVLLGKGGLVRAYGKAAGKAIDVLSEQEKKTPRP